MSIFKKLKKVFKSVHHVLDPINPLFKDKKKSGPAAEKPHDYQADLDKELSDYQHIGEGVKDSMINQAKTAGTYSDSPQFNQEAEGEAGVVTRYQKDQAQNRINELRKRLGLPTSAPGTV